MAGIFDIQDAYLQPGSLPALLRAAHAPRLRTGEAPGSAPVAPRPGAAGEPQAPQERPPAAQRLGAGTGTGGPKGGAKATKCTVAPKDGATEKCASAILVMLSDRGQIHGASEVRRATSPNPESDEKRGMLACVDPQYLQDQKPWPELIFKAGGSNMLDALFKLQVQV